MSAAQTCEHGPVRRLRRASGLLFPFFLLVIGGVACSRAPVDDRSLSTVDSTREVGADSLLSPERILYGDAPSQFGELMVPDGDGPWPVVVLFHGGFWLVDFGLDLMQPIADDLVSRGYAVWNLEFRRVGEAGGGYPGTFDDVAAGLDHLLVLKEDHALDLARVALVGHSSGGHLALWVAGREEARVDSVVVIGQAAVVDLRAASEDDLGRGAVRGLMMGRPDVVPERYQFAQPELDPDRVVLIHGRGDALVPFDQVARATAEGIPVVEIADGDHFSHLDPTSSAWAVALSIIDDRLG